MIIVYEKIVKLILDILGGVAFCN